MLILSRRFIILLLTFISGSYPFAAAETLLPAPEASTGYSEKKAVHAKQFMIVAAHPLASEVGYQILKRGGSAIDAAVATQLVLNLVEPHSSGIGGGAFMVYFDSTKNRTYAYDGREIAPLSASSHRFLGKNGIPMEYAEIATSGITIGVPGVLRVMELAHQQHGKLTWQELFEPAIQLAEHGFPMSSRLNKLAAKDKYLKFIEPARSYFFKADGTPKEVGTPLVNPEFADVLKRIAKEGPSAFYNSPLTRDIVKVMRNNIKYPSDVTEADFRNYKAVRREPVCGFYHTYKICGMPPPSSGAISVLQLLGILQHLKLAEIPTASALAIHFFSEAGRLTFADRDEYIADSDYVNVPTLQLLDTAYLKKRADLINSTKTLGKATAGTLQPALSGPIQKSDSALEVSNTSHLSIIDRYGNAVAMTTSIGDAFGSRQMVHGFLLNNELADFTFNPVKNGTPVVNRVEPGKRPRSSMAPTLVFDNKLKMVLGAPGGSNIINYVAETLMATLDWRMGIQDAIALPHFGSRNGPTELEQGTSLEALQPTLEKQFGHEVKLLELNSGIHAIERTPFGLVGGADPRREGVARGD